MTDVELGIDDYHRWAETPPEMLEQMLVTRLRSSGQYKAVQRLSSSARGDYVLRGHLFALNEMDDASGIKARFSFQLELFDPKAGTVVWSERYTARRTGRQEISDRSRASAAEKRNSRPRSACREPRAILRSETNH